MQQFNDSVEVTGVRMTSDGYLTGYATVARSGVQLYTGAELQRPDLDVVRVYRPPEEVFSRDAMRSYAYRPVTSDHPSEAVTADNWGVHARGITGDEVMRDGDVVRVPMVLMDGSAINEYNDGKREISMGYSAVLEWADGVTPDGERYDAIQRRQRMNHLALVARARGGDRLTLGDKKQEVTVMSDIKLRQVILDGLTVETTDAGAQAIERLTKDVEALRADMQAQEDLHAEELKARDADMAKKDAEIEKLKAEALTADQLDAMIADRAELLDKARTVADLDYSGKGAAEIRRMAVADAIGDDLKGKSDDYVEARFDILAEDAKKSGENRNRVNDGIKKAGPVNDSQAEYEQRLTSAWRQ